MDEILQRAGLNNLKQNFERENITPDIISKLSQKDFLELGLSSRAKMMELRIMCCHYSDIILEHNDKFIIPKETLESLLEINFKIKDISEMFNLSESTLYRQMRAYNLSKQNFSLVSDHDLDTTVLSITKEFPNCGEVLLMQLLSQRSLKVQRYRLRESLHRINEPGIQERRQGRLSRRVYSVESANRLWHIDTNHKLIRWKFVIAGGVDGFSRLITFLRCLDNNRAPTLLECFKQSVVRYGLPNRVRSDKGMENTLIADYMIQQRGVDLENAWDNHRIRTVHRSPMQMFTASVMNETVQVEQIHNDTSNDNDVPGETIDGVHLLGLDIQLNPISMVQLNENCPKNWISEDYGIDIYRQAVEILQHQ
ncbi:unnamed protein product [Mytilus edulis]|uniref:Integrase catalytic domain-containing protein n=1 Tax=Mytilus edulis TaxID=6550 RepID=A0A8S3SPY5_MYTED|nr:unnamed protein product [Mytilus edulis]